MDDSRRAAGRARKRRLGRRVRSRRSRTWCDSSRSSPRPGRFCVQGRCGRSARRLATRPAPTDAEQGFAGEDAHAGEYQRQVGKHAPETKRHRQARRTDHDATGEHHAPGGYRATGEHAYHPARHEREWPQAHDAHAHDHPQRHHHRRPAPRCGGPHGRGTARRRDDEPAAARHHDPGERHATRDERDRPHDDDAPHDPARHRRALGGGTRRRRKPPRRRGQRPHRIDLAQPRRAQREWRRQHASRQHQWTQQQWTERYDPRHAPRSRRPDRRCSAGRRWRPQQPERRQNRGIAR